MKIKLTKEEAARFIAVQNGFQAVQLQANDLFARSGLSARIQSLNSQKDAIVADIKKRVKDIPNVPIDQWDFSRLNEASFEGEIVIPNRKTRRKK